MADARLFQPTFTGGEISPDLYGRKDFARYQVSVKQSLNMYINATGGASNRAGLRLVGEVKNSAIPGKLLTFEAAGDDAFLLVFGNENMRPVARGSYIDNGGVPYELAVPWKTADLPDLYLEQSNDVATLTHHNYPPHEIARYSALDWRLSVVNFQPAQDAPTGVTATTTQGYTGYDASHLPVGYDYKVSAISEGGEESLPTGEAHTTSDLVFGYEKNYVTISWTAAANAETYQIFRGSNGVFGSIGTTPNLTFKDNYIAPDFSSGPQSGYNPFAGPGAYPSIVFFSQQRRGFAHTLDQPQTIFMTQSGNFKNMSRRTPSRDDDAIEFTLAAQKKQDIRHVLSMEKGLIVFTRSGEWRVTGSDGGVITPSSILPEPQSQYGAAKRVKPMIIGEAMVFLGRDNRTVYEMEYSFEIDRYTAKDMNLLAKHLFKGRRVLSWAHAADPYGMIWCVMDDGTALSLTYMKEHDVWGWGRHDTSGLFLDVAVVPEGGRDVPYFLVKRRVQGGFKVFIEMLEEREDVDMRNAFFVDCGLSYDNPIAIDEVEPGAVTRIRVDGHGLADGDEIEVDGSSFVDQQDKIAGSMDGRYLVTVDDVDWLTLSHARMGEGFNVGDPLDTFEFVGDYPTNGVMRKCIGSISGLDHLNGRQVIVLSDGFVVDKGPTGEPLVVEDGALPPMPEKFARIHVGLSYRSIIQTLDLINTTTNDIGVEKSPGPVFVNLLRSRGMGFGFSLERAIELRSREGEGYYDNPEPKNGLYPIEDGTDWSKEIEVFFVQDYPLPCTVLGVNVDTNYGGDGG